MVMFRRKRRYPYRRRYRTYKRRRTLKGLGRRINYVRKELIRGRELKSNDLAITTVNLQQTLTTSSILNIIALGDNSYERTGRKITMKSVYIKGFINYQGSDSVCRIMLVIDRQCNGNNIPGASLLLQNGTINTVNSPLNLNETGRFQVLYDRRFTMVAGNDSEIQTFYIKRRLNIQTYYDGNTATIADMTRNSITLCYCSTSTATFPTITAVARLRYVDS